MTSLSEKNLTSGGSECHVNEGMEQRKENESIKSETVVHEPWFHFSRDYFFQGIMEDEVKKLVKYFCLFPRETVYHVG